MNKQNEVPIPPATGMLYLLEYDITDDEVDFLIRLGTKARTIQEIAEDMEKPILSIEVLAFV